MNDIFGYDLNSWVRPLSRRRWSVVLTLLLAILPFVAAGVLWPRTYQATGSVIIGDFEPGNSAASAWLQKLGDPADVESQLLIAKSDRMLRLTLEHPGVLEAVQEECHHGFGLSFITYILGPPHCEKLLPNSEELLGYVKAHFAAATQPRSRVLSIGYRSRLRKVSFILANALLITYLEDQRAEDSYAREAASKWVLQAEEKLNRSSNVPHSPLTQSEHNFYDQLYKKARDLETERRNLPNPSHLVSLAEIPTKPESPNVPRLLAAGFAFAAALAVFVAFQKDRADKRVRRTGDVETLTSKPVLGSLPLVKALRSGKRSRLAKRAPAFVAPCSDWKSKAVAEAARTLYARLLLSVTRKPGRCILVSSGAPGEGKTFTTMALACAAAGSGHRVLVIDCDFRAPAEGREPGLADVLREEIEPQEAVIQTPTEGLEIIPAGIAGCDPAILLIDGQLTKLMNWVDQYELVLLDGPSGFPPDVRILAEYADGLLWCVRWGHTLLPNVKADLEELHRQGVRLLGLAVTMVDPVKVRRYEHNPHFPQRI